MLYGDADVLKQRAVEQLAQAWLEEGDREFGLVRLDATEKGLDGITAELAAGSLMAPRRMVVVRDIAALTNDEQQALAGRLEPLQPGLAVVLVAQKQPDDWRRGVPVAAALRRAVQGSGQIVRCNAPGPDALPGWAASEMQRLDKRIRPDAARVLCETVGSDVDRLLRELEKLAAYVGDREEVAVEDVQAVSVRVTEENIFDIMDAVGRKDAAGALSMLDGVLPEGCGSGEYFRFLGMLQRQIRMIWQARYLRQLGVPADRVGDPPEDVATRLPEHHNFPELISRNQRLLRPYTEQAARFSDGQLARGLDRIYRADLQLKGLVGDMDERTVVELLIADLCT
ncbi:MAG: DNA polymerase III subunit delta [Armatimonadota bacterium]